jgi:LPXTG-site transpeptidase (sortase) family protein
MHSEEHMIESPYASKHEQWGVFFLVFVGALALTYGFFFVIDFLPEKPGTQEPAPVVVVDDSQPEATTTPMTTDPYPVEIIFDALDNRSYAVLNPESRAVSDLDAALLKGAVRHPDSADFMNPGTIFLFGHSSYLPKVINKNFQAFNGIQKLEWGDLIRLRSSDAEYVYRVDKVYEASADDAEVEIEMGIPKLTLVTCDSFGEKSDRFIVEASLIKTTELTES